jgi:hypothetical protein
VKSKNLDKSAEKLKEYFKHTDRSEAELVTLVAMQLRSSIMEVVFWARNEEKIGEGLFEYCDPYEEADSLIGKLRLFGFLPPNKCPEIEKSAQPGGGMGEGKGGDRG